jgi:RHS repeat-associated protein
LFLTTYYGQHEDIENDLYYNRFRYYDPEVGVYISQDPIGLIGGLNLYGYVSDSLNKVDLFGLSECGVKTFYTVQDKADAIRLRNNGTPWPTDPHRAHFGEGVYAWGSKAEAENYFTKVSRRTGDLEVVEFSISTRNFDSLKKLDMTKMSDDAANDWLSKHSTLYGDGVPHNLDYITRGTGMGQSEHYFSKDVYHLLSF